MDFREFIDRSIQTGTVNIKAIAFEKTKSETIINGLSGIAYFLTALVLFV